MQTVFLTRLVIPGPSAGGIVFYVGGANNFSWDYLEAAPSDLGSFTWSTLTTGFSGAGDTTIGTGQYNTFAITNASGHTASAAQECVNYTLNGYSDLFLPSIDELEQMYVHRNIIGGL